MKMCYICNKFVDTDHDCETAQKLAEKADETKGVFWLAMAARPTRVLVD